MNVSQEVHNLRFFQATKVAVAICLLHQKPSDISGEEYTQQVQSKFILRQNSLEVQNESLKDESLFLRQQLAFIKTNTSTDVTPPIQSICINNSNVSTKLIGDSPHESFSFTNTLSVLSSHSHFLALISEDKSTNEEFDNKLLANSITRIFQQLFLLHADLLSKPSPQICRIIHLVQQDLLLSLTSKSSEKLYLQQPSIVSHLLSQLTEICHTMIVCYPELSLKFREFYLELLTRVGTSACSLDLVTSLTENLVTGPLLQISLLDDLTWWNHERLGFLCATLTYMLGGAVNSRERDPACNYQTMFTDTQKEKIFTDLNQISQSLSLYPECVLSLKNIRSLVISLSSPHVI